MKNFFNKFRSYSFWVSLSAAVIILLNALGKLMGFTIENKIVEDVIMSVAGLLVVLGIVTNTSTNSGDDQNENEMQLDEQDKKQEENDDTFEDENEKKDK